MKSIIKLFAKYTRYIMKGGDIMKIDADKIKENVSNLGKNVSKK